MRAFAIAALGALLTAGCAQTGTAPQGADALAPSLAEERIAHSTDVMESALGALYTRASLFEEPKKGSADWDKVILAGMDYADEACGEYLTAYYIADRDGARTPRFRGLGGLFGSSTSQAAFAGPGGLRDKAEGAETDGRGLQAAAFLTANEASRAAYRRKLFRRAAPAQRREKFAALSALRGYLALCAPGRLEAQLAGARRNVSSAPE